MNSVAAAAINSNVNLRLAMGAGISPPRSTECAGNLVGTGKLLKDA
jgi:hypothetical protein